MAEIDPNLSLMEAVEASLEGMKKDITPADAALVTSIRMAAEMITGLMAEGKMSSAMGYMYLVTGGLDKLGGSLESRKKLGVKGEKPQSKLAMMREGRGNSGGKNSPGTKTAPARRKKAAGA